jgi:hypothetical protein
MLPHPAAAQSDSALSRRPVREMPRTERMWERARVAVRRTSGGAVTGPSVNVDTFRHRPAHELAVLLPDEQAARQVLQDLQADVVDVTRAQILHGQEGARILDRSGREHGFASTLVRLVQNLGYDESILHVYDEALRAGEALLTVPCSYEQARKLSGALNKRGGHGMIYFRFNDAEMLSAP